jgi:hypothetical protein
MRLPFRFGANTLHACPQLFVRVDVEVEDHATTQGYAAELMMPKWFDKRAAYSPATNVEHLALSLRHATDVYLNDAPATPFGLFARHYCALLEQGQRHDLTQLSVAFGQSLLDRAVLDALCRACKVSLFDAARHNLPGLTDTALADDMRGWHWPAWLAQLEPLREIQVRHTVGLLDELDGVHYGADGLPTSLPAVIDTYGHRFFKIKVGGDPVADLRRLHAVLDVLRQRSAGFQYTLDGNEQYADPRALLELVEGLRDLPKPLYVEQPLPRDQSLAAELPAAPLAESAAPMLMDEADGTLDAFARGRRAGWSGVSSKACKGLYKSLINRARCERWNREEGTSRYFMSAEDLTCPAGVCVQQDLALVSLLGLTHCERNGHHYGDANGAVTATEQRAFSAAHPDLYGEDASQLRLRINRGAVRIDSLFKPGFAHAADPDFSSLQPPAAAAAFL